MKSGGPGEGGALFGGFLERHSCVALPLLLLAVAVSTFRDYGITWDETAHSTYGKLVLQYFASGFQDKSCNEYFNLYLYGPFFDALCAAVHRVLGGDLFEIRHFLTGLCMVLTVLAVCRMGGLFQHSSVPLLAGLSLVMLPRFYGHGFNNSKDIPFAWAVAWAMYAITALLMERHPRWRSFALAGAAIGLALAIRMGGLLLLFFLLAGASLAVFQWRLDPSRNRPTSAQVRKLLGGVGVIVGLSWLIMVLFWPWMHENPLVRPFTVIFRSSSAFPETYPVLFEGAVVDSSELPWYYLPKYLLITTPPTILFLALLGSTASLGRIVRSFGKRETLPYFLVLLWFFFPVAFVMLDRPNVYDGIRHFLFILPAMALLSGIGASSLAAQMLRVIHRRALAVPAVMALVLIPLQNMVRLHPYQVAYFNSSVGGVSAAWKHYDTDYFVSSYKEAAEWVNAQARSADRPLVIVAGINRMNRLCLEHYLDREIRLYSIRGYVPVPGKFDYFVSSPRYGALEFFPELPVVHVVGREGAIFTFIRRGPSGP